MAPYAPVINISGLPAMGVSPILPQSRVENIFQADDSVSWARGRHGFKFGMDYFKYQDNSLLNDVSRGEFFYGSVAPSKAERRRPMRNSLGIRIAAIATQTSLSSPRMTCA